MAYRRSRRNNNKVPALPKRNTDFYEKFFWKQPVDLNEVDEIIERTDEYRQYCAENGIAPLAQDYAFVLGYSESTIRDIRNGVRKRPREVVDVLIRVHMWLEACLAQVGIESPELITSVIWYQKNGYGYADKVELSVPQVNPLGEQKSIAEIERRMLDSVVDDGPEIVAEQAAEMIEAETIDAEPIDAQNDAEPEPMTPADDPPKTEE